MASLSNEYLIVSDDCFNDLKQHRSAMFNALVYSTSGSDLTALLNATEAGLEKLPILTLSEAKS